MSLRFGRRGWPMGEVRMLRLCEVCWSFVKRLGVFLDRLLLIAQVLYKSFGGSKVPVSPGFLLCE